MKKYDYNYTYIENGNQFTNEEIRNEVDWIIENRKARRYNYKSNKLYIREWKAKKRLNKEIILKENNSLLKELLWLIIGGI